MREEADAKIRELGCKCEEIVSEVLISTDALNLVYVCITMFYVLNSITLIYVFLFSENSITVNFLLLMLFYVASEMLDHSHEA